VWVRIAIAILCLLFSSANFSSPAKAQEQCSVALVLALDVSGSVDWREYRLQRKGIADAFSDDELIDLIEYLPGGIAVAVSQWSGTFHQENAIGWHRIATRADALKFAKAMRSITRNRVGAMTATGNALLHAELMFRSNPYQCGKKVVDVSSDGKSNQGLVASQISDQLDRNGTTINVLAILEDDKSLIPYFAENVVRGPASFVQSANDYADYFDAIKRKLLRELTPNYVLKTHTLDQPKAL